MEKQISIIIPTYNMEKYIGKCLDSLLIPEFDQVEVLVVNDGSKDRSSEIAHSYADRYPDSIRVIDKSNGNYGSCINAALPQATGRYVKVLDADDTFDSAEFSKMIQQLQHISADVVVTPFLMVDSEGNMINYYDIPHDISCEQDLIEVLQQLGEGCFRMHNIAYRTSIFSKFRYTQTEGISYTDTEWAMIPMGYCDTVFMLNFPVYRYLMGREGQTMSLEQRKKSRNHLYRLLRSLTKSYLEFDNTNRYNGLFHSYLLSYHQLVYYTSIFENMADRELLQEYDTWLAIESPTIYKQVGELGIVQGVPYKFINESRKSRYATYRKLPIWLRCWIFIRRRL